MVKIKMSKPKSCAECRFAVVVVGELICTASQKFITGIKTDSKPKNCILKECK